MEQICLQIKSMIFLLCLMFTPALFGASAVAHSQESPAYNPEVHGWLFDNLTSALKQWDIESCSDEEIACMIHVLTENPKNNVLFDKESATLSLYTDIVALPKRKKVCCLFPAGAPHHFKCTAQETTEYCYTVVPRTRSNARLSLKKSIILSVKHAITSQALSSLFPSLLYLFLALPRFLNRETIPYVAHLFSQITYRGKRENKESLSKQYRKGLKYLTAYASLTKSDNTDYVAAGIPYDITRRDETATYTDYVYTMAHVLMNEQRL